MNSLKKFKECPICGGTCAEHPHPSEPGEIIYDCQIHWQPQLGPQLDFCQSDVFEVFIGGSAGGGKSDCLLMEGLRQCWSPNYVGIIFRKTSPQLAKMINRSRQVFPKAFPGATFNIAKSYWKFPSGAEYWLSHLQDEEAVRSHEGKEYQYVAFDELTHFSEEHYRYLVTRCRTSDANLKTYVRASGMPKGPGVPWVKERFIDIGPYNIVEEKFVDPVTGKEVILDRMFIPARLEDNVILMQSDPLYDAKLRMGTGSEKLYKALRLGNWDIVEGAMFEELDKDIHMLTPHNPPEGAFIIRAMDWGYAKPYAIYWAYEDFDGRLVIFRELYGYGGKADVGTKQDAREVAREILAMEQDLDVCLSVADPSIWTKIGIADKDREVASVAENMESEGVFFERANNDILNGIQEIHTRLRVDKESDKPWLYVTEDCKHWWRTVPVLQYDERRSGYYNQRMEDHAGDCLRYLLISRPMHLSEILPSTVGRTMAADQDDGIV